MAAAASNTIKKQVLEISNVSGWLYNEPPPLEYIFEGVLKKNITGFIHAVGGCGKSFFMNSLLFSLCTGTSLWSQFKPARAFKVMYLTAEDSEDICRQRFWNMSKDFSEAERTTMQQALEKNLILIAGQPLPLLVLKDQNPTLAEGFKILMELISKHKPDVLFIDPKSMAYGSLDENSNSHNTAFVSCLKKFNELGVTVLFSHHEGKGLGGKGLQFSSRGGQALSDGVRWQIALSAMSTDEAKTYGVDALNFVKVEQTKSNYTKFIIPFWLKRGEGGALVLADLQTIKDDRITQVIKQVLESGFTCKPREFGKTQGKEFTTSVKDLCGATIQDVRVNVKEGLLHGVFKKDEKGCLCAA